MQFHIIFLACRKPAMLLFLALLPLAVFPGVSIWAGTASDGLWSNPVNWLAGVVPDSVDDILLDNSNLPGSYTVILPDHAVTVRTIRITPSSPNRIELILPPSNTEINALRVKGPGYGILLDAGAVFRNASGLASGESLQIADSIRINDDGRYVHQTRTAHANSILRLLSSASGTEKGVFEFDVPKASYTISASNRTYGSLVLSALAYGLPVNYTCSGSSPLRIGGDLRIGSNVSWSLNMSGLNGNVLVKGDYVQTGGFVDLASGAANSTYLQIQGNLMLSPGAVLTASGSADPGIEINGNELQQIDAEGMLTGNLVFRVNNPAGCRLLFPLNLPHRLDLIQGPVISTETHMLRLAPGCRIQVDSAQVNGSYVNGPLRKEGLTNDPYFLFPVGGEGHLRWLELKQATGNFTVEYRNENPASIGTGLDSGIDHISKMEYWRIDADSTVPPVADVELSFVSPESGGVTDPDFLNVSGYVAGHWSDAGHTGITGGIGYGSVVSKTIKDFSGKAFTLASTVDLENPLPLTVIRFAGREINGHAVFRWSLESAVKANHFDLLEAADQEFRLLARIDATKNQVSYNWSDSMPLKNGPHWFRLNMIDDAGRAYPAKTVLISAGEKEALRLFFVPARLNSGKNEIHIRAADPVSLDYRIISLTGQSVRRGILSTTPAEEEKIIALEGFRPGVYLFNGMDASGSWHTLPFVL